MSIFRKPSEVLDLLKLEIPNLEELSADVKNQQLIPQNLNFPCGRKSIGWIVKVKNGYAIFDEFDERAFLHDKDEHGGRIIDYPLVANQSQIFGGKEYWWDEEQQTLAIR